MHAAEARPQVVRRIKATDSRSLLLRKSLIRPTTRSVHALSTVSSRVRDQSAPRPFAKFRERSTQRSRATRCSLLRASNCVFARIGPDGIPWATIVRPRTDS
jgi:hypothetical protein